MRIVYLLFPALLFLLSCKTQEKTVSQINNLGKDQFLAEQSVDQNKIKGHIYFIAGDELKGRDTPSDELNIAASYIANNLRRYGVKHAPGMDSYYQRVPMTKVTPANEGSIQLNGASFQLIDDFLMLNGDNLDLDKELIFLDHGTAEDFSGKDIEDKIVVTIAGYEGQENPQEWFYAGREKQKRANEAKAAAIIEIYGSARLPWNILANFFNTPQTIVDSEDPAGTTPYLWVSASNSAGVQAIKKSGDRVKVTVSGLVKEPVNTYNIVGYIEGNDATLKEDYVIYSAHYDHVGIGAPDAQGDTIYNGARDNAVGVVTVLSVAENLAKHPTKRSGLFIFFTGEEKGLLGSAYYADHPVLPLNRAAYCFNSDNAGYNDTSKATIIGLTRTHAQPIIEKACSAFGIQAIEDPAPEQNLFDRSDNVNFAKKGVPAPTFAMGLTAFDEEINKYYHQAGDGPETLDYDYLEKFFKAYVYAARMIGNTDQSLFWKEGDKYYEIGKELYNK